MASTHDEYTQMTRNSSQLDLTGAYISEDEEPGTPGDNPTESASAWKGTPEAPSIGLPQQTVDDVSHFSIGARAVQEAQGSMSVGVQLAPSVARVTRPSDSIYPRTHTMCALVIR
jgi:hypothetical protein